MKVRTLVFLLAITFSAVVAQAQIVFREAGFAQALASTKQEGKMLFLDAVTATCAPCKRMVRETFSDPEVAALFNEHFVNLRMDLNVGEGPDVQARYNITDFPTLLFMDGNGDLVEVHVGFLNAERFLAFGKSVLAPDFVPLSALHKQYTAHPEDRTIASAYIIRQSAAGRDVEADWKSFRPGMKGRALLNPENWAAFKALILTLDAPEATYFVQHRAEFSQKYGPEMVNEKFFALHRAALQKAIFTGDSLQYKATRRKLLQPQLPDAENEALYMDLHWHLQAADWNRFYATATALDSLTQLSGDMLDWIASNLCNGASNPDQLAQALAWSKRAVAAESSYGHLDTQFSLLVRLGHREAAIAMGKAAIAAAKASKEPYGSTEETLHKLEAGK
jgi:thioredoxin-related protein